MALTQKIATQQTKIAEIVKDVFERHDFRSDNHYPYYRFKTHHKKLAIGLDLVAGLWAVIEIRLKEIEDIQIKFKSDTWITLVEDDLPALAETAQRLQNLLPDIKEALRERGQELRGELIKLEEMQNEEKEIREQISEIGRDVEEYNKLEEKLYGI